MLKRVFCMITVVILIGSFGLPISAIEYIEHNYTINPFTKSIMPVPNMYKVEAIFENTTAQQTKITLNKPQDIFIDKQGYILVADTGNNRVLKFDDQFNLLLEIKEADGIAFKEPNGVFVDKLSHIYVADSLNNRVVHLSANGEYIESFVKPESEFLPENVLFNPSKIVINENQGLLYILFGKQFITIDAKNNFKGFVGSERVGFSLRDFFVAFVGSKEQKNKLVKREPPSFSNIFMSNDGVIYATSLGNNNQIKALNTLGENYFVQGYYGEETFLSAKEEPLGAKLIDLTVDSNGFITTADANSSKLYLYDRAGNLLGVYGGEGNTRGKFTAISALANDESGRIYVLDSSRNNITVFTETAFTQNLKKAIISFQEGKYEQSFDEWQYISKISSNYPMYEKAIGEIYIKKKQYTKAMEEYKISDNKGGYLQAFSLYRYEIFEKNFGVFFISALLIIVLAILLLLKANRIANRLEGKMWSERGNKR